jgi:hypothetical protein
MKKRQTKIRCLAWLPAILLIASAIVAASGASLSGAASAAPTTVTATVGATGSITDGCAAGGITWAVPTTSTPTASAGCALVFGTNNGSTTTVQISGNQTPFLQSGANNFGDAVGCTAEASLAVSKAGVEVTANGASGSTGVTGGVIGTWCTGTLGQVRSVPTAATDICKETGVSTTGTCTLKYAANAAGAQPSGSYTGTVTFTNVYT